MMNGTIGPRGLCRQAAISSLGVMCLLASIAGCNSQPKSTSAVPDTDTALGLPAPEAARANLSVARDLERNGYDAQAITNYERALSYDPTMKGVAARLAVLYDRTGNERKAREWFAKALVEEPADSDLRNDYGYFLLSHNQLDDAKAALQEAVQLDPNNKRAINNLGVVLVRQGDYDGALAQFSKILPPAEAKANLGVLQAQDHKFDLAKRTLTEALSANPEMKAARAVLAWLDKRSGPMPDGGTSPVQRSPTSR